jgi:hypothetical protein
MKQKARIGHMEPGDPEFFDTEERSYDRQELGDHLQQVVQSECFTRTETLKKILLYLWDHRDEKISEYAIAIEALGRRADFDPKTDATVRVQIARLRRKLKDYYEMEKTDTTYVLHIPIGSHELIARKVARKESIIADPKHASFSLAVLVLVIICITLIILNCLLLWDIHGRGIIVQRHVALTCPQNLHQSKTELSRNEPPRKSTLCGIGEFDIRQEHG